MKPEEFRAIGERALGYGWQSALARDIGVASRTVRRWASGEVPIPDDVAMAMAALGEAGSAEDRAGEIAKAASLEAEGGWMAVRDGKTVAVAHLGALVYVGEWDRGIKNLRPAIDRREIESWEAALRLARKQRIEKNAPEG